MNRHLDYGHSHTSYAGGSALDNGTVCQKLTRLAPRPLGEGWGEGSLSGHSGALPLTGASGAMIIFEMHMVTLDKAKELGDLVAGSSAGRRSGHRR